MHATVRPWIILFLQCTWDVLPWFKGGFGTYYENMCVAQRYGLDQVVERRFKPMYQYYISNIAGPPEVDQLNFSNHSFVEYFKSALTAYYINELLIEHSNGTKGINDFMKLLFNNLSISLKLFAVFGAFHLVFNCKDHLFGFFAYYQQDVDIFPFSPNLDITKIQQFNIKNCKDV